MADAALFHREQIVGRVQIVDESTHITAEEEKQVLIIRLDKQAGLIKELMKEELISFNIEHFPATQG